MIAYIYIRENGKIPADFSVVMKKHTRSDGVKARLAGGQLNLASVRRLRGASWRKLYISKHDFQVYIAHLIKNGYRLYGHVKDFIEKIPVEAAEVLDSLLSKYPKGVIVTPARWFNNCK